VFWNVPRRAVPGSGGCRKARVPHRLDDPPRAIGLFPPPAGLPRLGWGNSWPAA